MTEGRAALLNFLTNENKSLREELRRIDEREQFYKEDEKYYEDEMDELRTELAMTVYLKNKSCERLEKKLERILKEKHILMRQNEYFRRKHDKLQHQLLDESANQMEEESEFAPMKTQRLPDRGLSPPRDPRVNKKM